MVTDKERLLKAEHDAWLANSRAMKDQANMDYLSMMLDVEIPTEDTEDEDNV